MQRHTVCGRDSRLDKPIFSRLSELFAGFWCRLNIIPDAGPLPNMIWLSITVVGAIVLYSSLLSFPRSFDARDFAMLLATSVGMLIGDKYTVKIRYRDEVQNWSFTDAFIVAAIVYFDSPVCVIIVPLTSFLTELVSRIKWYKIIFNVSQMAISVFLARLAFELTGNSVEIIGVVFGVVTYYVVNNTLVCVIVGSMQDVSPLSIYRYNSNIIMFSAAALGCIGAGLVYLYKAYPFASLTLLVPMFAVYYTYNNYVRLNQMTALMLKKLSQALEQRDPYTANHSRRVMNLASRIASELDLPEELIRTLEIAGEVHDIGKIGIRDEILFKPGKLDETEYGIMKQHPKIAEELLSDIIEYRKASQIVRHHHERWDGKGYPDGIAGEEIPLSSRILAVADAFDAMTSDRPYRRPLSITEAISQLRENSGTQFDPLVSAIAIRVIEQDCLDRPDDTSDTY